MMDYKWKMIATKLAIDTTSYAIFSGQKKKISDDNVNKRHKEYSSVTLIRQMNWICTMCNYDGWDETFLPMINN